MHHLDRGYPTHLRLPRTPSCHIVSSNSPTCSRRIILSQNLLSGPVSSSITVDDEKRTWRGCRNIYTGQKEYHTPPWRKRRLQCGKVEHIGILHFSFSQFMRHNHCMVLPLSNIVLKKCTQVKLIPPESDHTVYLVDKWYVNDSNVIGRLKIIGVRLFNEISYRVNRICPEVFTCDSSRTVDYWRNTKQTSLNTEPSPNVTCLLPSAFV